MTTSRSHAVVIPTASRDTARLATVVDAVRTQVPAPREVVVACVGEPPSLDATIVRTERLGTASQRNAGLAHVTSDVVHFIDDDVVIAPGYLAAMDRAYDRPGVVGATGNLARPLSTAVVGPQVRRWLQGRPASGRVSRAGVAEPIDLQLSDHDVAWMPAAAMSMRTELAVALQFDEVLERGPTGPYALNEDVDLTVRLSHHGRLRFVAGARAEHIGADTWRLGWPAYWEMRMLTRRYLASKPDLGLSRAHARAHLTVDLALAAYLVVSRRSSASCLVAAAHGVIGPGLERRSPR